MIARLVLTVLLATSAVAYGGDRSIRHLPKCADKVVDVPDGWQLIEAPDGDIAYSLPTSFHRDESERFFVHGGENWIGPGLEVRTTYGSWDLSSFGANDADHVCRTRINGISAVVFTFSDDTTQELAVWLRTQTRERYYEPVLGITYQRAHHRELALEILNSVHLARPK